MNRFLEKMERRFGHLAIPHLTMVLVASWVIGYALQAAGQTIGITDYMSLNIYSILHGEIWRLVTWIVIPPSDLSIWTMIMLLFYVSIGTTLERTWGDFRYNVYLLGGMLILLLAGCLTYGILGAITGQFAEVGTLIGKYFSTYYIAMSMLLAYAMTFPNAMVYIMFVLPLRMKWLGWFYGASMVLEAFQYISSVIHYRSLGYVIPVVAIAASLLNFGLFYLSTRQRVHLTREQKEMRRRFRENMRHQQHQPTTSPGERVFEAPGARYRCEVCGRTDVSNPELEFRYCTKCEGAHEYCMDHLYTHEHKH